MKPILNPPSERSDAYVNEYLDLIHLDTRDTITEDENGWEFFQSSNGSYEHELAHRIWRLTSRLQVSGYATIKEVNGMVRGVLEERGLELINTKYRCYSNSTDYPMYCCSQNAFIPDVLVQLKRRWMLELLHKLVTEDDEDPRQQAE